jgi:putative ABC transport system permease protein
MATLRLALRNVARQRGRTALTLAAIAFGVASLVLCGGFVEDILLRLREATIHSQLGHLQVAQRGQFENGRQRPYEFLMADARPVLDALRALPRVAATSRRLAFFGLAGNGRSDLPIVGEGVEPGPEARIGSALTLVAGRALTASDDYAALVGEGLAAALKLKVGDRVDLVVSTPEGAANTLDFLVTGIFRSLSKEYDARGVRIPLAAAQELTATQAVSTVVVLLDDTDATAAAAARLRAALPAQYEVRTWRDLADFYNATAALYARQFGFLGAIIVVMVLLSVANTVNMTLHERIAEFGIMRSLGRSRRDVFRLAVLETALQGAIGAAIGVVIGALLALAISAIGIPMSPPPNSEAGFTAAIRLVPWVLAAAFAAGLAASVCAALLPARHLARMPLVDALGRGI